MCVKFKNVFSVFNSVISGKWDKLLTFEDKRPTWCHLLFYFNYYVLNVFRIFIYPCSSASACNTDTTPTQPHRNSNTHRTKNNTTNVVIQQNSSKLLMMDILMSETCWAHKKWNKIASDIKLVFYSSTVTMTHGPINIKLLLTVVLKSVPLFFLI